MPAWLSTTVVAATAVFNRCSVVSLIRPSISPALTAATVVRMGSKPNRLPALTSQRCPACTAVPAHDNRLPFGVRIEQDGIEAARVITLNREMRHVSLTAEAGVQNAPL